MRSWAELAILDAGRRHLARRAPILAIDELDDPDPDGVALTLLEFDQDDMPLASIGRPRELFTAWGAEEIPPQPSESQKAFLARMKDAFARRHHEQVRIFGGALTKRALETHAEHLVRFQVLAEDVAAIWRGRGDRKGITDAITAISELIELPLRAPLTPRKSRVCQPAKSGRK